MKVTTQVEWNVKIKVTEDVDYHINNDDCDTKIIVNNSLVGFFDSVEDAKEAVNKLIKNQEQDYELKEIYPTALYDCYISEIYNSKPEETGNYYSIGIYYELVIV